MFVIFAFLPLRSKVELRHQKHIKRVERRDNREERKEPANRERNLL